MKDLALKIDYLENKDIYRVYIQEGDRMHYVPVSRRFIEKFSSFDEICKQMTIVVRTLIRVMNTFHGRGGKEKE